MLEGVVGGIGGYGNCLGIPNVGGEVVFAEAYSGNPLVNAMCVGIARVDRLASAVARGAGNPILLVGADTGRDGIHGASGLASRTDPEARFEEMRPAVQVGNPFMEKLLMEACYELASEHPDWFIGLQDCGAAGLTSAVVECCAKGESGAVLDLSNVPRREKNMTPYEVMLSESQERMVVVAKADHVQQVTDLFLRWELHCTQIGEVVDGDSVIIKDEGIEVGRVPWGIATDPPEYVRDGVRDLESLAQAQFNLSSLPDLSPDQATDTLLMLLARPNIASRARLYRQYDQQVLANTIVQPGGDAAVVRIDGTDRAFAVATDGSGRICYLDPFVGGAVAVAEAARNVVCTGATPVAVTDCLNFGNPEKPEVYYTLEQAVKGISAACEAFGTPVVSGNVSLFNESGGGPIYPTPVIGLLGLLDDVEHHLRAAFERAGADVWLLGADAPQEAATLAASEYLEAVHGRVSGTPTVELEAEAKLQQIVLRANDDGLLLSAHDCSDGGLAVTLAECAITNGIGFASDVDLGARLDGALFGEAQGRIVVSLRADAAQRLQELAAEIGVTVTRLGITTETAEFVLGPCTATVAELKKAWESGLQL